MELRRVLRPGGVLAVRDSDYGAFVWAPADAALDRWMELYLAVTERNGHNARIGPSLLGLAHAAGFDDVAVSSTCWTFADPESRSGGEAFGPIGSGCRASPNRRWRTGSATTEELEQIAQAFLRWAASPDGVFVVPHVEILAHR